MDVFYTRVNLRIEIKDYPVGGILRMHFWMDGIKTKGEAQPTIIKEISNNRDFTDKYTINQILIDGLYYTSTKSDKEGFNIMVFDSFVKFSLPKDKPKVDNKPKPPKKVTFNDINLFDIDNDELKKQINRIENELFKRKYFFSDDEYNFYNELKDNINVEDTKDLFKKYNGDVFKYKKEKIREKLIT
jgi:hypothetical protein